MNEQTKLFADMTVKEQVDYITNLSEFAQEKLPRLEQLGDAWESADRKDFETGLRLISAFGFARDYCNQSLFYGDYSRRVARINYYLARIKKELAKGNALQGANGETLAYVPAQKVARRRGRPTKAEQAQMEAEKANEGQVSLETEKALAVAKLLGLETEIVAPIVQHEKTDAEKVAAIKAKEEAEKAAAEKAAAEKTKNPVPQQADMFAAIGEQIDKEKAEQQEASYRLSLQQVKPYLSADLSKMVDTVRDLRASFASKAERAKILAEQGAKPEDVAPYAQEAHDLNEKIENIYQQVDVELAMLYGRMEQDVDYRKEIVAKYHLEDEGEALMQMLKPYYKKMPATFAQEVESTIRENNPEVIAAKEKAAADKAAADKIIKYLSRKDKPSTAKRLDTMLKRMEELKDLIGEEAAKVYQPYVDKCREEVEAATGADDDKAPEEAEAQE